MKLSSLFQDKAYAFAQAGNPEDDCRFAVEVLKKVRPRFKLKEILLWEVADDFDVFLLSNDKGESFRLKVSLSDPNRVLAKEVTILRGSPCPSFPTLVAHGTVKVGEEVTYLLTKVLDGDSLRNYGRSAIVEDLPKLLEAYFQISATGSVRNTYKKVLNSFLTKLSIKGCLTKEGAEAVKSYTDYPLCEKFFSDLQEETTHCIKQVDSAFNYKCHGSLSLNAIFFNGGEFHFDTLHNVCMGHPFIDFIDLILDAGIPPEAERRLLTKFCEKGNLLADGRLYHGIYQVQLRKKLGELLIAYIEEVYLYESYRYEKILQIADTFSHCYERFCSVGIFSENRDFIMKTICEPVFGVKA